MEFCLSQKHLHKGKHKPLRSGFEPWFISNVDNPYTMSVSTRKCEYNMTCWIKNVLIKRRFWLLSKESFCLQYFYLDERVLFYYFFVQVVFYPYKCGEHEFLWLHFLLLMRTVILEEEPFKWHRPSKSKRTFHQEIVVCSRGSTKEQVAQKRLLNKFKNFFLSCITGLVSCTKFSSGLFIHVSTWLLCLFCFWIPAVRCHLNCRTGFTHFLN